MTQEDKELLLKDLCARLPYEVVCHYDCIIPVGKRSLDKANAKDKLKGMIPMPGGHIGFMVGIDRVDALDGDIKPYLRPMSSMTEEEDHEFALLQVQGGIDECKYLYACDAANMIAWLNRHHFDYNGLIEKGLALEAPEGMYKTE